MQQQFFQKVIADGTPLWVVITRDVVIPAFTVIGGAIAFFVWYRRKRIEHKLMHKTRAYEILLDKELACYEELLSQFDTLVQCGARIKKFDDKGLQEYYTVYEVASDYYKKNILYLQDDIRHSINRFIEDALRYYYIILSQNEMPDEIMDNLISETFEKFGKAYSDSQIKIKLHLEEISRIK